MSQNLELRPASEAERIHALDALRGMAILGVLLAYTVWNLGAPPSETWNAADRAATTLMDFLVDNKFLTTFAFLFGVGISQQWKRWEAAGPNAAPLHLRRMGFLFAVGILHGILLRNGDILAPYAILGIILLGFRRLSNRTIATAAVILFFLPYFFRWLVPALGLSWPSRPGAVAGGYFAENFAWLRYWYMTNPFLSWPQVAALMLAGVLTGRAGLIERAAESRSLARRILVFAFPLAVVTRAAHVALYMLWANQVPGLAKGATLNFLFQASSWTLAAAYAAGLLLISQGTKLLGPLRAIGRMAFTNYLLQALLVVPFCLAFGLFDRISPFRGFLLAVAVAALQAAFSTWWLGRYSMGPLERLWRGVTYGFGRVSMQKTAPAP
ncbi:MAG: DUF418 domain-containing protein [candidate division Zixibacteria bacterium]|nr:DUF418 domain-containing protein [candidate division Zixibacteria bacterium]MCI0596818.1 DUF418 domain-containing protein [candidate division Zixibacteria bacterium]